MTTVPLRPSNLVVAPHTSSANTARMGSGMWTVKAVSARFGRQATVPVTISTGSSRVAASLVLDSPSSTADPFLLVVTDDTTLATYQPKSRPGCRRGFDAEAGPREPLWGPHGEHGRGPNHRSPACPRGR